MCNAHLYTHACIYNPFFLIKFMILKDVLPEKVFISECVCGGCARLCVCVHVYNSCTDVRLQLQALSPSLQY